MSLRRHFLQFVGQHVECHTYYGSFHGVIVHCTKHHLILRPIHPGPNRLVPPPAILVADASTGYRQMPMGPMGPGQGGQGPNGWQMAIPLAAILGVTALGLHWF